MEQPVPEQLGGAPSQAVGHCRGLPGRPAPPASLRGRLLGTRPRVPYLAVLYAGIVAMPKAFHLRTAWPQVPAWALEEC